MTEPLNLRTKDVDLESAQLTLRAAKGGKDRVVAIPGSALEDLREQIKSARAVWAKGGDIFGDVYPGRRSQTHCALGYHRAAPSALHRGGPSALGDGKTKFWVGQPLSYPV